MSEAAPAGDIVPVSAAARGATQRTLVAAAVVGVCLLVLPHVLGSYLLSVATAGLRTWPSWQIRNTRRPVSL